MQLIRALLTMGKVVFGSVDSFASGHETLARAVERGCYLSLVATQLERLLRNESNVALLRCYRAIFIGGGSVSETLLERARTLELPLAPTYGMSETAAQVATLQPDAFLKGKAGQGKTLPHARLAIVDESGGGLPAGKLGRIQIRATSLFKGFYGEEEREVETLLTPDFGELDEYGNLTVLGRSDRVIISGGEKIDLREVERALEATHLVSDVVGFGVEDREWGSSLAVAYVPAGKFTLEGDLRAALSGKLADFKIPKTWLPMDSLPRNEAGKILLDQLIERCKAADRL